MYSPTASQITKIKLRMDTTKCKGEIFTEISPFNLFITTVNKKELNTDP